MTLTSSGVTRFSHIRDHCKRLTESAPFNRLVVALILLSCIILAALTSPTVESRWGSLLLTIDHFILWFFVVELAIRVIARVPQVSDYLRDGWNVFDAAVILLSVFPIHSEVATVFRLVRVLRALRLIKAIPRLQQLVGALLKSVVSLGYVGMILAILFFIYGMIGIKLFRELDPAHFGTLGAAFLALFQIVTLEGWVEMMRGLIAGGPEYAWISPLYFVSFILIGTMVVLNLIIGIIVGGIMENQIEERSQDAKHATAGTLVNRLGEIEKTAEELRSEIQRLRRQLTGPNGD